MSNLSSTTYYKCEREPNTKTIVFSCRIPLELWDLWGRRNLKEEPIPACANFSRHINQYRFHIITLPEFENEVKERLHTIITNRFGENITYRKKGMSITTQIGNPGYSESDDDY